MIQKHQVAAWVTEEIYNIVGKIAASRGVSISEYLRNLILDDLDESSILNKKLREELSRK